LDSNEYFFVRHAAFAIQAKDIPVCSSWNSDTQGFD